MMKTLKYATSLLIMAAGLVGFGGILAPALAGKTLDAVRQRGERSGGVSTGLGGISIGDSRGRARRCRKGEVRSLGAAATLRRAAIGRYRSSGDARHLDADARCLARPSLYGRL